MIFWAARPPYPILSTCSKTAQNHLNKKNKGSRRGDRSHNSLPLSRGAEAVRCPPRLRPCFLLVNEIGDRFTAGLEYGHDVAVGIPLLDVILYFLALERLDQRLHFRIILISGFHYEHVHIR